MNKYLYATSGLVLALVLGACSEPLGRGEIVGPYLAFSQSGEGMRPQSRLAERLATLIDQQLARSGDEGAAGAVVRHYQMLRAERLTERLGPQRGLAACRTSLISD